MKKTLKKVVAISLAISVAFTPIVPTNHNADAAAKKVFIAPYSGTKYHNRKSCRGLNRAKSISKIKLSRAKARGYTKCKICY